VRLEDAAMEARARQLFLEVRCVVCGGQVIENSDSNFSFEMRQLIREKILAKKSDAEIKEELVKEYGSNILVSQSISGHFGILLLLLFVIVGGISFIIYIKKS
jgi:cytochrome c-type biogenesis protein CcmH